MKKLTGILTITRQGFGLIKSNNSRKKIKVDKRYLNRNISGEKVEYKILKETGRTIFAEILSKPNLKNREFVGIVHAKYDNKYLIYNRLFGKSNLIACKYKEKLYNNFVKFKIKKLNDNGYFGKIIQNMGSLKDPNALTDYFIADFRLNNKFSKKVLLKADKVKRRYENDYKNEIKNRVNLTELTTFTIDPKGARDLDDAISILKTHYGYKAYIHIADVSYFVKKGTSIDQEALKRSFSVYLPTKVIRMLPPVLSENLCSLLPDTDKYAVTTEVDIKENGEIIKWNTYKSIIKSIKKFTYEEVYDIITKNINHVLREELDLLHELSQKLLNKRLILPERRINKKTNKFDLEYSDFSHSMIAELMILNNMLVATTLSQKGISYPARYHQPPNLNFCRTILELINQINGTNINYINIDLFQSLIDNSYTYINKLINLYSIQKMLTKARYDCKNSGHWALNLNYYSHFTSPIRRYPDLISHRLIFGGKINEEKLTKNLSLINDNEKIYQKIDFQMQDTCMIRHINENLNYYKNKDFDAIITKIFNPNITIFIPEIYWTKELNISNIGNNYIYNKELNEYESNNNKLYTGKKIKIKIKKVIISYFDLFINII